MGRAWVARECHVAASCQIISIQIDQNACQEPLNVMCAALSPANVQGHEREIEEVMCIDEPYFVTIWCTGHGAGNSRRKDRKEIKFDASDNHPHGWNNSNRCPWRSK